MTKLNIKNQISKIKLTIGNWKLEIGNSSEAKLGFTLIELLVVGGILVLCGGLIASVIFNTLRGSTKSSNTNHVAQNGNYALSALTDIVNSSDKVSSACDNTTSDSIQLENVENRTIYEITCPVTPDDSNIQIRETKNGGTPTTTSLLDTRVTLSSDCKFTCSQVDFTQVSPGPNPSPNPFINPVISIQFELSDPTQSISVDTRARALFQTSIRLRNYIPSF